MGLSMMDILRGKTEEDDTDSAEYIAKNNAIAEKIIPVALAYGDSLQEFWDKNKELQKAAQFQQVSMIVVGRLLYHTVRYLVDEKGMTLQDAKNAIMPMIAGAMTCAMVEARDGKQDK